MSQREISDKIIALALEIAPHRNNAAAILLTTAAAVLQNTDDELAVVTTAFSVNEMARIDTVLKTYSQRN